MNEAFRERERTDADVRRTVAKLLTQPHETTLLSAATTALIRARVARVRYAAALEAAGWAVPEHLLDDPPEPHAAKSDQRGLAT